MVVFFEGSKTAKESCVISPSCACIKQRPRLWGLSCHPMQQPGVGCLILVIYQASNANAPPQTVVRAIPQLGFKPRNESSWGENSWWLPGKGGGAANGSQAKIPVGHLSHYLSYENKLRNLPGFIDPKGDQGMRNFTLTFLAALRWAFARGNQWLCNIKKPLRPPF